MDHLCDMSAVDLRRLIGDKAISPVELLEDCLARIEETNPTLNAITATCIERAFSEARAAEKAVLAGESLELLHGLPIGIKDLQETAGVRTTFGSPLYADYVPVEDERVVAAIRRAGGIVVGKTNVPEFGAGGGCSNVVYGPTSNPFDPKRTCGGSSGGSAVALATGMLPLCTGSDTGGSVRIPAAFCGVVGFRTSPGLIASERRPLGWTAISVQGPMGRSVEDAHLLLRAQVSSDSRDPLSASVDSAAFATLAPVDLSRLRIAVSEDLGGAPIEQSLRTTFRERISMISSDFRSCDWRDPDMRGAESAFAVIRAQNYLAVHKEHIEKHREQLGNFIIANYEQGLAMSAADVAHAHAQQTRIYRALQRFFDDVDILICPTVGVSPFPLKQVYPTQVDGQQMANYFSWFGLTYYLSLTGHPCISIPCGLEPSGTPFALQICGPARKDKFVLEVAQATERRLQRDPRTARPGPKPALSFHSWSGGGAGHQILAKRLSALSDSQRAK